MGAVRDPVAILELDIRADLQLVESQLRESVGSDQSLVHEAALYLIQAGGKRIRPKLALLAGRAGDRLGPPLVSCAVSVELIHLASLYHDDVIDETLVRRGVPTAHVRYGNDVAVLTGDFLFARSSALAARLGPYVSERLSDTIAALCEGQIMEGQMAGRLDVAPEHYLEVIRRKTASLIASSCHLGAWLSGASAEIVQALTTFGDAIGMAFQLADDILDIAAEQEESGKVPGTDIREGVLTLPALHTLEQGGSGGDALRSALETQDVEAALGLLRTNGSLEFARAAVADWQRAAVDALAPIPDGPVRDALEQVAAFIGERKS
ncbi:MAG: polyprenyl synthetase family protein [Actinomycetota bacterium]